MRRAPHPRATTCHASPDPGAFPVRLCGPVSTASGHLCARRPRHTKNAPPCACHSGHGRQKPSHHTITQRPRRAHHRCRRTNQPTASRPNPHSFIGLRDRHSPPHRGFLHRALFDARPLTADGAACALLSGGHPTTLYDADAVLRRANSPSRCNPGLRVRPTSVPRAAIYGACQ